MEIIWKSIILLIFLMAPIECHGRRHKHHNNSPQDNNFDMFVYSLSWPQTSCFSIRKWNRTKSCNMPDTKRWTVHGLWPSNFGKYGPINCNNSLQFNSNNLKSIENDLRANWQGIDASKNHDWFWKHEWKKHGSCSISLELLNSMEKYFSRGLELYRKYNFTKKLKQANIVPGQMYEVQSIVDEVTRAYGKRGIVTCDYNKIKKEHYLSEIRMCFDKSLDLIHCDGMIGFPTSCPHKNQIYYPDQVPSY